MSKKWLFLALFAALLVPFAGCSSDDDDDDPVLGIALVAVGDDGTILTTSDTKNWTKIDLSSAGSISALDLVEVIKLPGTTAKYVTYGQNSTTPDDSEIWFSSDCVTWAEATITELTDVRASTYFTITDMHFVNSLEGIAVGTYGLVLWTDDGGETWTEMNTWSDTGLTTNPGDVEISFSTMTPNTSGNPIQGTTLTQAQTGGNVTGDVVCWDVEGEYVVVTNIAYSGTGTATFNSTDNITWGTDGTTTVWSVDETDIWRYDFNTMTCIYGVEVAGTGSDTTLTFWMANDNSYRYEGMWKLVSSAAVPGAARTWTWTTPTEAHQASATTSDFCYDDTIRFFFFDADTGVAARSIYGIAYTEDGGDTWTYGTNTNITGYDEYWSEFWYIDNGATGWLYSVENDGYVARVGILYDSTATPPYQFNIDTSNDWEVLTSSGTNNSAYSDDHTGTVLKNNATVFAICINGSGYWTYGSTMGSTTFDDDVFTDTWQPYLGAVMANGANPFEDDYIGTVSGTTTTTYYMNHWTGK